MSKERNRIDISVGISNKQFKQLSALAVKMGISIPTLMKRGALALDSNQPMIGDKEDGTTNK